MIIAQPKELIGAYVNVRQGYDPRASWGEFNALGLIKEGRLVAGVIYNDFSGMNCHMHIGAEEGCRWLNRDFLFAAFDYPFNQLGRRRVMALMKSKNPRAIEFIKNIGFEYEGTLRHFYKDDDAHCYGLLRENCRFLEMRKVA